MIACALLVVVLVGRDHAAYGGQLLAELLMRLVPAKMKLSSPRSWPITLIGRSDI